MTSAPHSGLPVRFDRLAPLMLGVTDAARRMGISRKQLSDVMNDRSAISPDLAVRLDKAFGGDAATRSGYRPLTTKRKLSSGRIGSTGPILVLARYRPTDDTHPHLQLSRAAAVRRFPRRSYPDGPAKAHEDLLGCKLPFVASQVHP